MRPDQPNQHRTLQHAIRRYQEATESLRSVAHYMDRDVLGRAPTQYEETEFLRRKMSVQKALRSVCTFPMQDLVTIKEKAKFFYDYAGDSLLGKAEQRMFTQSIMQIPVSLGGRHQKLPRAQS